MVNYLIYIEVGAAMLAVAGSMALLLNHFKRKSNKQSIPYKTFVVSEVAIRDTEINEEIIPERKHIIALTHWYPLDDDEEDEKKKCWLNLCKHRFPTKDGWYAHDVVAIEVKGEKRT